MISLEISCLGFKRFSAKGINMWRRRKGDTPSTESEQLPPDNKRPVVLRLDAFALILFGIIACVYLFTHEKQGQNSAAVVASVLGFLAVIIGAMIKDTQARGQQETRDVLDGQNKELFEIKTKVNGHTERMLQALEQKHQSDMQTLESALRAQIHKLEGSVSAYKTANEHLEEELKKSDEEKKQLLSKVTTSKDC
jgi:Skp family chaperone for outer membrane proteins